MFVTFSTEDLSVTERLELDPTMQVSDLKGLLEAIFNFPANQQALVSGGKELEPRGTVESIGLKNEDFVFVVNTGNRAAGGASGATGASSSSGAGASGGGGGGGSHDLQDVFARNRNPRVIVKLIQGNEALMKQLQYYNPTLAAELAKDEQTAVRALTKDMMKRTANRALEYTKQEQTEADMLKRQQANPNDPEVIEFFKQKEQEKVLAEHRARTMEEFPESFVPVLMLYINTEVNGVAVQAFVDSGAQTSVMSSQCAERCGLTPYIDKTFAGKVVGVGDSRTLGKVLFASISIEGKHFPISVTILDSSQGFGDKNMEFLLGLDMLKRHQCVIDLISGKLQFTYNGVQMGTPFLHEKDLPRNKGGNRDN